MAIIEVQGLAKTFAVREKPAGLRGSLRALFRPTTRQVQAVKDISFAVEEGERVAFIGPNGAGKSTTIKKTVPLSPAAAPRHRNCT